jgi:hypothetical protein
MATTHTTETALHDTQGATKGRKGIGIATGSFAAMFAFSGVMFLVGPPDVVASFRHLGYPDYFRPLLGVAKLLGVAALVLPLPVPALREWAYAGCTFTCLAAALSHAMSGDAFGKIAPSLFALAILMTSYLLRRPVARDAGT